MASQLCKLFFRQKLVNVSSFRNVYLSVRRLKILRSRQEGLKKSFPAVLNNLSNSNNHRSRDTDERNWRRPFIYFAVLGVVNATENEQKSPKGDSHICRPSVDLYILLHTASMCALLVGALRRARKKIYAAISSARS